MIETAKDLPEIKEYPECFITALEKEAAPYYHYDNRNLSSQVLQPFCELAYALKDYGIWDTFEDFAGGKGVLIIINEAGDNITFETLPMPLDPFADTPGVISSWQHYILDLSRAISRLCSVKEVWALGYRANKWIAQETSLDKWLLHDQTVRIFSEIGSLIMILERKNGVRINSGHSRLWRGQIAGRGTRPFPAKRDPALRDGR